MKALLVVVLLGMSACETDVYVADCMNAIDRCNDGDDADADSPPPRNDRCEDATPLLLPLSGEELIVDGTTRAAKHERDAEQRGLCSSIEGGADVHYAVRVEQGPAGIVEAKLDVEGAPWPALVYSIGGQCDSSATSECVSEDWRHASAIDADAGLVVVVDGAAPGGAGDFRLSLRFAHVVTGGETCVDAPSLNAIGPRGRVTMVPADAVDDVNAADFGNCSGEASSGGDVVYAVTLAAGESLFAQYEYPVLTQGARFIEGYVRAPPIYVLDGCPDGDVDNVACVAGSDSGSTIEPATVNVTNETTSAKTYFLVLEDVAAGTYLDFVLSWSITG